MTTLRRYGGAVGLCGVWLIGCGEGTELALPSDSADSGPAVSACYPEECTTRPPECVGEGSATGPATVFVVSKLYLGDTDRNGVASPDAWKSYGYDIDGTETLRYPSMFCRSSSGSAEGSILTDGIDGTDNSFGANVVPALLQVVPDLGSRINEVISKGELSLVVHIDRTGDGACYVTPAQLFIGGGYFETYHAYPEWKGTDAWPLQCELLETCLPEGTPDLPENRSRIWFPASFVADGVWVDGSAGDFALTLSFAGVAVRLRLRQGWITGHIPSITAPASDGIIAGVMEPEELIAQLRLIRGALSPALCDDQAFETVADAIRRSADLMIDGTAGEGETCNGISVGIGFDAVAVELGPVLNQRPTVGDACTADAR